MARLGEGGWMGSRHAPVPPLAQRAAACRFRLQFVARPRASATYVACSHWNYGVESGRRTVACLLDPRPKAPACDPVPPAGWRRMQRLQKYLARTEHAPKGRPECCGGCLTCATGNPGASPLAQAGGGRPSRIPHAMHILPRCRAPLPCYPRLACVAQAKTVKSRTGRRSAAGVQQALG